VRERLIGQEVRTWRPLSAWLTEALPHEPSARCGVETAGYKRPKRYEFVEALPMNPSGKVLKRELLAAYDSEPRT
jgi:acyl-CoA synthetase (AMP-forming)/AMP-acid ligase II